MSEERVRRSGLRIYRWDDWFFRLGPVGFTISRLEGHHPLFSERYGYRRRWHVRDHCVGALGWFEKPRNVPSPLETHFLRRIGNMSKGRD